MPDPKDLDQQLETDSSESASGSSSPIATTPQHTGEPPPWRAAAFGIAIVAVVATLTTLWDPTETSDSPSDPEVYSWSIRADLFDPDLSSPTEVVQAYVQRWFRGDGSHRELELTDARNDLRRALYRSPIAQAPEGPPTRAVILSRGGTGPGRLENLPEYAFRNSHETLDGVESGGGIAEVLEVELIYSDGSKSRIVVPLRPTNLVEIDEGPAFATDPLWGVVPPPDKAR